MTLIISECKPDTSQEIMATRPIFINAIRPHLYIHGSPAGTVKVQVQDVNGYMIAESATQSIATLKTEAYAHKYYLFEIDANLMQDGHYRIAVVCGGGYVFSESAYVGVCHDWDNTKSDLSYVAVDSFHKPLDLEIWERKP